MKLRDKKVLRLCVISSCLMLSLIGLNIGRGNNTYIKAVDSSNIESQEEQLSKSSENKDEIKSIEEPKNTEETKNTKEKLPYQGKKILILGDSISAYGQWTSRFEEIVQPEVFVNVAVAGATISDNVGTKYNGNPSKGVKKNNTLGNQLEKIKNKKKLKLKSYQDFESIIIFAGTNDSISKYKDVNIEKQFTTSKSAYKSLKKVDKITIPGSMRYIVESLQSLYPNAQIFICTTIQSAEDIKGYNSNYIVKNKVIKDIAYRLSVPVIDVGECGIYGRYEVKGDNGKHLYDGIHPNKKGGKVLGEYIVRKYMEWYAF